MHEHIPELHKVADLMDMGYMEDALSELVTLSAKYPTNYQVVSMMGECYLGLGQPEMAIKPLRWAKKIKKLPKDKKNLFWVDHYLLGTAYSRCMKFYLAMRHFTSADELCPNNSEVLRNIGWIHCIYDQTVSGRALLMRAITLDPFNALAHHDMGVSYMAEEKLEEAKLWIDKAHQLDPLDEFISGTVDRLENLMAMKILFKSHA